MKQNMGDNDRSIRLVSGIIALLVIIFLTTVISDAVIMLVIGIILYVFATIMIFTSIIGTCPLYTLFRISTKKQSNRGYFIKDDLL